MGERDRGAEAGAAEARRARDQRLARLQLLPRARRLLGRARPARGVAARADAGGRGHLSGARDVPGVGLRRAARVAMRTASAAATGPTSACPASTVTASRSRCSTPASTRRTRTSTAACFRASTCSTAAATRRRARTRRTARSSSSTGRSSPASSSARTARAACAASRPRRAILPIRVAGWQAAADGRELVYGRSDQLIAGLDRAVDPNGDGDEHDAVRVALVGVDGAVRGVHRRAGGAGRPGRARPEHARRHAGRERRRRRAGVRLGRRACRRSGGARGRRDGRRARRSRRCGSSFVAGSTSSSTSACRCSAPPLLRARRTCGSSRRARPPVSPARRRSTSSSQRGLSLVAGKAVVLPGRRRSGGDRRLGVACRRGGRPSLRGVASGRDRFGCPEDATAPAVVVPSADAVELLAAQRAGLDVGISVGAVHAATNTGRGIVASFSSAGARVRRVAEAEHRRARRRDRHVGAWVGRRPVRALRDRQRDERRRRNRRRCRGAARADAARPRRRRPRRPARRLRAAWPRGRRPRWAAVCFGSARRRSASSRRRRRRSGSGSGRDRTGTRRASSRSATCRAGGSRCPRRRSPAATRRR